MSKTINIYGDSFGASTSSDSWVNLLKQQYTVNNFCSNGTSEYRIYKTLKNTYKEEVDIYIIVHTSPYRVYIANNIFYKNSVTHKKCDLLLADTNAKINSTFGRIVKDFFTYIYCPEFTKDISKLCIDAQIQILKNKKVVHITNFQDSVQKGFIYFDYINSKNKGNINHYNKLENRNIHNKILEILNDN